MLYHLSSKDNRLEPKAASVLRTLLGVPLFHNAYRLRHPLEIYNISMLDIVTNLSILLDLLKCTLDEQLYRSNSRESWEQPIISALDHVLDALMQHIDACKSIVCCFFDGCEGKDAKHAVKKFFSPIKTYRDHVAKMVNYIKHRQRILRLIYFHNAAGVFVLGYFVEGVVEEGVAGPDPDIHANANVAISFNRDIPYHVCNLFKVSAALSQSVYDIAKVNGVPPDREGVDNGLTNVLKKTASLPTMFFPDEVNKPVPFVHYTENHSTGEVNVTIEMPSLRAKPKTVPSTCQVSTSWRVGEVSHRFKVPYSGLSTPDSSGIK